MVKDNRLSQVLVLFLGITLVSSSFTAFSSPVFAAAPGTFIDAFVTSGSGGLDKPYGILFGPDGNLYVSSYLTDEVLRYDGSTGAFIDVFVTAGSGGLNGPDGLSFGPDGNFYVDSYLSDSIKRYDGTTGTFIDVFVSPGSGGLDGPYGLLFGPDGNLYVSSEKTDEILRYDGTTGAFIDAFVTAGSGGLDDPYDSLFAPDGKFYVASGRGDEVLRYNGSTGAFIDVFVTAGSGGLNGPDGLSFGSDGNLYVPSESTKEVLRYDGTTGAFIDAFVTAGSGGLDKPYHLLFGPGDNLYVVSGQTDEILRFEGPLSVNSDPIAQNDAITTTEDSMITFSVLADNGSGADWDPDGDTLDVISVDTSGGTVGLVTLNLDDTVSYDPNGLFDFMKATDNDTDSFDYTISDGMGGTHKATVTVTLNGVDDTPTVSISSPTDGDSFIEGMPITFSATASDPEDGVLTNINWNSSIDGYLGFGGPLTNSSLSVGTHTINATVSDFTGNSASSTHTITVNPIGTPTVSISAPVDGDSFEEGTLITLSGNALDPEDGGLSASITWTSDVYGIIGSGASISSSTVPIGFHIITASVTDSDGNIGSNSIGMTVTPPILANPPTVSITTPVNGDSFDESILVSFQGTASDPEDGVLTASISWNSDFDGAFGLGGSLSMSSLATETHVITASITDSDGNTSTDSITITVSPAGQIKICHLPPGNPSNYQELMISPSALVAHVVHGDYEGVCETDEDIAKNWRSNSHSNRIRTNVTIRVGY